jgi:hypothetical protein
MAAHLKRTQQGLATVFREFGGLAGLLAAQPLVNVAVEGNWFGLSMAVPNEVWPEAVRGICICARLDYLLRYAN